MRIESLKIRNFRLLRDVELCLADTATVIVGRNNSGKTSLTELFRRLLSERPTPSFALEDFSLPAIESFWGAFQLFQQGGAEEEVRRLLPTIEIVLRFAYGESAEFGPLGDFVIDLDSDCTEAAALIRYELKDGKIKPLFDGITFEEGATESDNKRRFFAELKARVRRLYAVNVSAVDPGDALNEKSLEWANLRAVVQPGFINAQRGLDDMSHRENDVLGRILESLFTTALAESADAEDQAKARELETAVKSYQDSLDGEFNERLTALIPALTLFGYPGLTDPGLVTETTLDVKRLLTDNTKIRYGGTTGVTLPEAYNGLGSRNLIFILLKLLEFFKSYKSAEAAPGVHLVFVEEPEAHLHPQMQEVFIRKLGEIADLFAKTYNNDQAWPVQFVVTTHSPHIANEAPFDATRYFLSSPCVEGGEACETRVKDLSTGLSDTPEGNKKFLHQYMTLTRCDLLFADKAVLIEGSTERLLLPRMIEKTDGARPADASRLSSQYLSVMEVGGAYAHRFFDLLSFLELPTLVITDIDATNKDDDGKACMVADGTNTSNACIKEWFAASDVSPVQLIAKSDEEKIKASRRLAYQVSETEGGPCGRSFEDAFMLANPDLFELTAVPDADKACAAWGLAKKVKKTEFALEYAIDSPDWIVPRYIADGLDWLAEAKPEVLAADGGPAVAEDAAGADGSPAK